VLSALRAIQCVGHPACHDIPKPASFSDSSQFVHMLDRMVAAKPDSVTIRTKRAELWFGSGSPVELAQSLVDYTSALTLTDSPGERSAVKKNVQILEEQLRSKNTEREQHDHLVERAEQAADVGDHAAAVKLLTQATEVGYPSPHSHFALGMAYHALDDLIHAVPPFLKAMQLLALRGELPARAETGARADGAKGSATPLGGGGLHRLCLPWSALVQRSRACMVPSSA